MTTAESLQSKSPSPVPTDTLGSTAKSTLIPSYESPTPPADATVQLPSAAAQLAQRALRKWLQDVVQQPTVFCSGSLLSALEQHIMGVGALITQLRLFSMGCREHAEATLITNRVRAAGVRLDTLEQGMALVQQSHSCHCQ